MIRRLEEISIDAWPALRMELHDGWVLRFADGYSRRSNSVYPLYRPEMDPREKIQECERIYGEIGLRTVFKMTAACEPRNLDDILAGEGYRREASTSVQLLDLAGWEGTQPDGSRLQKEPSEEWLITQSRMSGLAPGQAAVAQRILALIRPPRAFASLEAGGQIVACGLGMIRRRYLCLYDIVVDEQLRRQGYGRRVMEALLDWGRREGVRTACLQVMKNNPPALALYAGIGFGEEYEYWYRAQP
jgi:ribosomal protein S18 acetylase RimI-like enzyme